MSIRVFLADDHDVFRQGLSSLLSIEPGIEVVGEAGDGRSALAGILAGKPDIVLMDVTMPGLNGIEATRQLRKGAPKTRVIALSMHSGQRFVGEMLQAGASGYLSKKSDAEEVVKAIRAVAEGEIYLSPSISGCLVRSYLEEAQPQGGAAVRALTPREREILQMFVEKKTTKEIAAELKLSLKTVFVHKERIMEKLGIKTLAGLTKYAVREGLTDI